MIRKSVIFAAIFVLIPFAVRADVGALDQNPYDTSKCSAGAAMDQFECIQSKLEQLETVMKKDLQKAKDYVDDEEGAEAKKEKQERIQLSQDHWLEYRNGFCEANYYTKAVVHPASLSLEIAGCKYKKTDERITEINEIYFPK